MLTCFLLFNKSKFLFLFIAMQKVLQKEIHSFLGAISKGRVVYATVREESETRPAVSDGDTNYYMVRADAWDSQKHLLAPYRPVEPLKSLIFRPRELLGMSVKTREIPEAIVIGVKNCDLSALKIHDYVFMQSEPADLVYREIREKTIIVSMDCSEVRKTCFCTAVKQKPYASTGFDINLSPVSDGFLVEAGSERGKALLKQAEKFLVDADRQSIEERERCREEIVKLVNSNVKSAGLSVEDDFRKAVEQSREAELWGKFARDCVECGACNFVCCTCHCFLLTDGVSEGKVPERMKQWDSCLYRNFARVAGGANPRKYRAERLYNRFDKKFSFFPQILGSYACDGCGRCIESCAGKIDIRQVLKEAVGWSKTEISKR